MADETKPANPVTDDLESAVEAGYLGQPPDPNPNEDYTLEGVIKAAKDKAKDDTSKSSKK